MPKLTRRIGNTEKELLHLEKKKEQARIMRERAKQNNNSKVVAMG